jgi:hypothetical protein
MAQNYTGCYNACAAASGSGLDTAGNVIGILTFAYALAVGIYLRIVVIKNATKEIRDTSFAIETHIERLSIIGGILHVLNHMNIGHTGPTNEDSIVEYDRPQIIRDNIRSRLAALLRQAKSLNEDKHRLHVSRGDSMFSRFLGRSVWVTEGSEIARKVEILKSEITDVQSDVILL